MPLETKNKPEENAKAIPLPKDTEIEFSGDLDKDLDKITRLSFKKEAYEEIHEDFINSLKKSIGIMAGDKTPKEIWEYLQKAGCQKIKLEKGAMSYYDEKGKEMKTNYRENREEVKRDNTKARMDLIAQFNFPKPNFPRAQAGDEASSKETVNKEA